MKKQNDVPRAMKNLYALGTKRPVDLSLSENPFGCSPMVFRTLKQLEISFNDYPKPNGGVLKKALSKKLNLSPENFFIANGSESIIADIPRVFGKNDGEAVMPSLTFPMFKICSELAGLEPVLVGMKDDLGIDLVALQKAITPKTQLLFLCNPNNPTGGVLSKSEMLQFLQKIPERILVIIDEANIEFGGESMVSEVEKRKNVIVLRTFSKGFGLASLRLGFAVASREVIQKLEEETPIFPVSSLSEKLGEIALSDTAFIEQTRKSIAEQRDVINKELQSMGFRVFPSEANNIFAKIPEQISAHFFFQTLEKSGISLVMGSNFTGFNDRFFRVSIRTAETNRKFLDALQEAGMLL